MKLSKDNVKKVQAPAVITPAANAFELPEKVLQFGTGVLLRGLPDFYIDKANNEGIFNGRIVVVKSTSNGGTNEFDEQDGLFTHCIRGIEDGQKVEEVRINSSISRVLSAKDQWEEILACATNSDIEVVISNTTEVGIALEETDKITDTPPSSFPGKLLAILYKRFHHFNGDAAKGLVIVPTELIPNNGSKLESIILELAHLNNLEPAFMDWLEANNHFCNSLVDRIVPGKLPAAQKAEIEAGLGYTDDLMIMSESYSLWAIETADEAVAAKLSFSKADKGVVIAPNIDKFRELKLRLLNGTHTLSCGVAFLAGFTTVKQAMDNATMSSFIQQLMIEEIAPAIPYAIEREDAVEFSNKVLDRFRNPHIEHNWIAITMQYSSKMKMRNLPVLLNHYSHSSAVPEHIAAGFAAHILFMKSQEENGKYVGELNGNKYPVQDDNAAVYAAAWQQKSKEAVVHAILTNHKLWETDLAALPGFEQSVINWLSAFSQGNILEALQQSLVEKQVA